RAGGARAAAAPLLWGSMAPAAPATPARSTHTASSPDPPAQMARMVTPLRWPAPASREITCRAFAVTASASNSTFPPGPMSMACERAARATRWPSASISTPLTTLVPMSKPMTAEDSAFTQRRSDGRRGPQARRDLRHASQRALDHLVGDLEVRHQPDLPRQTVGHDDAGRLERRRHVRRPPKSTDVDVDHVRLDRRRVDLEPVDRCQAIGESMRRPMIVQGPAEETLEGDDASRRDDACLAHAPAHESPPEARLFDERARPDEERPERAGEPLREVHHRAVDAIQELAYVEALGGRGIEDAGSVEVDRQTMLARHRLDRALMVHMHHGPRASVVGVLEPYQPSARVVDVGSADGCLQGVGQDVAAIRGHDRRRDASDGPESTGLVVDDVGPGIDETLVGRVDMAQHAEEVRHRPGQDEHRGLGPEA